MLGKSGYKNRVELLQGTLDMLILRTLQWGSQPGYGIVRALRISSGELLQVETGSLYPALHRLVKRGWIRAEWKHVGQQRAKHYSITAAGKKQLTRDLTRWQQIVAAVSAIMHGEPEGEDA